MKISSVIFWLYMSKKKKQRSGLSQASCHFTCWQSNLSISKHLFIDDLQIRVEDKENNKFCKLYHVYDEVLSSYITLSKCIITESNH